MKKLLATLMMGAALTTSVGCDYDDLEFDLGFGPSFGGYFTPSYYEPAYYEEVYYEPVYYEDPYYYEDVYYEDVYYEDVYYDDDWYFWP